MKRFARWFKNKEGGKSPPGAMLIQMALKFHTTPDVLENLEAYHFNRMVIWMEAEDLSEK